MPPRAIVVSPSRVVMEAGQVLHGVIDGIGDVGVEGSHGIEAFVFQRPFNLVEVKSTFGNIY